MASDKKKNKLSFELWRDRLFSVLVPIFLGYIFLSQTHNNTIKIIILVILLGFATGEAALIGRHILAFLGKLTGLENGEHTARKNEQKENNYNDEQKNKKET